MEQKELEIEIYHGQKYAKSSKPLEEHKHRGWFYHYPTKTFYRWDDIPYENK